MTMEQTLGILRHVLTAAGGYLIARGILDETMAAEATGAILTLAGLAWSIWAKRAGAKS